MKTMSSTSPCANKIQLHLFWGPDEAIATWDWARLATASATVSDGLLEWLRAGAANGLDPARVDFLVNSFIQTMLRSGWDPYRPQRSARPLCFGLWSQGTLIEVAVRVQARAQLRFELRNAARH